jgi:hypothetical protein
MTGKARSIAGSILLLCLGIPAAPAAGDAVPPRPLAVNSQSPMVGIFGIPRAQGVDILGRGNAQWDATVDLTSHFQGSEKGDENIFLDGETARVAIQARYGINERWNVGLEVPWVHHGPGFLDSFIINWHDLWGFPQNGRDELPRDAFTYRYERDGQTRFNLDSAGGGLGDIVVAAQRHLWRNPSGAGVLHAQLKLPTGDADKLTGSGAMDAAAGIELSRQWRPAWHSMFRSGVVYLGESDVLPDLQRNWAAYGGFDLVWRPIRALSLRVQYDAHTPPYKNSGLRELSRWSGLLTTGGTWHISRRVALDLAVVENVPNTDVVSDVSFQLRLRTTPGDRR